MKRSSLLLLITRISIGLAEWTRPTMFLDTPTNLTFREGTHAFLPCRVSNLADRSITWMRKDKLHIISADMLTYSPDDRYKVLHPKGTEEWTLYIKYVQKSDSGWYECQVNSDPKQTRQVLLLVQDKNVDDPFYKHEEDYLNSSLVTIDGPAERFMQRGSALSITCIVKHTRLVNPDAIIWYHGGTLLDYDSPRGGIALQSQKTKKRTVSKLMLSAVKPKDSGRYTCDPDSGGSTSITVHVQGDQQQAAVQQSGYNSSVNREFSLLIALTITSLLYAYLFMNNR